MSPRPEGSGPLGEGEPGPRGRRFRVGTLNVRYGSADDGANHWNRRRQILLDAIGALDAQVLGVQECLPFQADEIKASFPHLDHFGFGRYHSVPVPRPHESLSGEHCAVFYDSRHLELGACGTFWHSDTPELPGSISWGNSLPRITTWGILRSRQADARFAIFNTHLHWDEPYVSRATALLVARIRAHAGVLPVVLVGDFNLTPDSETHARLTDEGPGSPGLRDVWTVLGKPEQGAGTHHGFTGEPRTRIDWMLASARVTPLSAEISVYHENGRYPSDHFPVVAELAVPE